MTNLAEDDIAFFRDAVAQLQRVDAVVIAKAAAARLQKTSMRHIPTDALSAIQVAGRHIDLEDVRPAVVIEIRNVDAHARDARVLEPTRGSIRERSIPGIDVHDIVGW